MICEKCGKNNPGKNTTCAYCKAPLPGNESCGGFADILSFTNVPAPVTAEDTRSAGMNEADARRLIARTNGIVEYSKRTTLFALIGVGICSLMLILTIVFFIILSVKFSDLESAAQNKKPASKEITASEQLSENPENVDDVKENEEKKKDAQNSNEASQKENSEDENKNENSPNPNVLDEVLVHVKSASESIESLPFLKSDYDFKYFDKDKKNNSNIDQTLKTINDNMKFISNKTSELDEEQTKTLNDSEEFIKFKELINGIKFEEIDKKISENDSFYNNYTEFKTYSNEYLTK